MPIEFELGSQYLWAACPRRADYTQISPNIREDCRMYEGGKGGGVGAVITTPSAVLLPNTGGNVILTVIAVTGITIGSAILLTTLIRFVAKRAYNQA